jgi:peptidoglycan/LPS O-acetylase OafA/YrhL
MDHVHVPALDGIRGFAILAVMAYHFANSLDVLGLSSPLLKPFALGWAGVDVFFALSGFLITGILIDTKSAPRRLTSFYGRRVLRIFPLYYLALLVVLLLQLWIPDAGVWGMHETPTSPGSLLWPATFLQNVAIGLEGRGSSGITTHYWSLAVEEHFYLVWPALVMLARNNRQILALAVTALIVSIGGRMMLLAMQVDLNHMFAMTPVRMDGLALGACAAVLVREYDVRKLWRPAAVVLIGSLVFLAAAVVGRHTTQQSDAVMWLLTFPLTSAAGTAVIIMVLSGGTLANILSTGALRWLGKYSYGLYVWHPIIGVLLLHSNVALTRPGADAPQIILAATAVLALDFLVAWMSYNWVERRFLALKHHFAPGAPSAQPARASESAGSLAQSLP